MPLPDPSETRQWAERARTEDQTKVTNRGFAIAVVVIIIVLAMFALVLHNL